MVYMVREALCETAQVNLVVVHDLLYTCSVEDAMDNVDDTGYLTDIT